MSVTETFTRIISGNPSMVSIWRKSTVIPAAIPDTGKCSPLRGYRYNFSGRLITKFMRVRECAQDV
jgi:hypothetical protein